MTVSSTAQPTDGRMARGLRTRARVLRVALTLFGARGFHAVSMKELAETAGIKPASIYNHFASKEMILATALAEGIDRFQDFVRGADDPQADSLSRLQGVVERHTQWQLTADYPVREADSLLDSVTSGELLNAHFRDDIEELMLDYRLFVMNIIDEVRQTSADELPSTTVCTTALLDLCDRAHRLRDIVDASSASIEIYCWNLALGMLGLHYRHPPISGLPDTFRHDSPSQ